MSKKYLTYTLLTILFISGCSKKNVGTSGNAELLKEFKVTDVNFDYLTTNSKIKFDDGDKNFGATANIRIKKDSVIWISITPGFGIELARAMITQDSVKYMNRMDKEYDEFSFAELSQRFNFDMSYGLLQSVLLGNLPLGVSEKDDINRKGDFFVVTQEKDDLLIENFVNAQSGKLERVAIIDQKDKKSNNTLNLSYTDFQALGEDELPFQSDVSLNYQRLGQKKRTEVNIQHKKASFEDEALRFPFSIPDKYVRH